MEVEVTAQSNTATMDMRTGSSDITSPIVYRSSARAPVVSCMGANERESLKPKTAENCSRSDGMLGMSKKHVADMKPAYENESSHMPDSQHLGADYRPRRYLSRFSRDRDCVMASKPGSMTVPPGYRYDRPWRYDKMSTVPASGAMTGIDKPTRSVESARFMGSTRSVKSTRPIESTKSVESTRSMEPTMSMESKRSMESTGSIDPTISVESKKSMDQARSMEKTRSMALPAVSFYSENTYPDSGPVLSKLPAALSRANYNLDKPVYRRSKEESQTKALTTSTSNIWSANNNTAVNNYPGQPLTRREKYRSCPFPYEVGSFFTSTSTT